jgi:hypothetical protein
VQSVDVSTSPMVNSINQFPANRRRDSEKENDAISAERVTRACGGSTSTYDVRMRDE